MFRSLLRTLPSLSGNISLCCHVNPEYKKNDIINTYVKEASLEPLDSTLTSKHLNISLVNNRWEYDVATYYKYFANSFYTSNDYNNKVSKFENYDITKNNINNNIDYLFGCKRISYKQYGYQFMFYAPFFINNIDDLPDYFEISIKYNPTKVKKIRILLNDGSDSNYLGYYISKYVRKINSNVIYVPDSKHKAMYYGIDIKKGGLVKYQYDDFANIYKNHTTINTVDSIINLGFKTNNIIMQQIIPLAFIFNLDDIFSAQEKSFFRYHSFDISGYYVKNNHKLELYDFSCDYVNYYPQYLKYVENIGKYVYTNDMNVMDINNKRDNADISLHEKYYINYLYSNKLLKNYNHWTLYESNNKYVTNINYSYSSLNASNNVIRYGEFPSNLRDLETHIKVINGDAKLPINSNINTFYATYNVLNNEFIKISDDYINFKTLMDNNVGSWFSIYDSFEDIYNNNLVWENVNNEYQYNSVYYKGILYNLYDKYDTTFKVDKFGVFINPILKNIEDINSIYNGKFIYSLNPIHQNDYQTSSISLKYDNTLNISNEFYNKSQHSSNLYYLNNDLKLIEDKYNGTYVRKDNYYEHNKYYKLNDIVNIDEYRNLNSNIKKKFLARLKIESLSLYERLPLNNNINLFQKNGDEYKILFSNILFGKDKNNKTYANFRKTLYISIYPDREKLLLTSLENYDFKYNELNEGKYTLFAKLMFISYNKVKEIFKEMYYEHNIDIEAFTLALTTIDTYNYIPYQIYNGIYIEDYIEREIQRIDTTSIKNKQIYIDTFNLNNYLNINLDDYGTKEYYTKFLNKHHIKEYITKLYQSERYENSLNNENINSYNAINRIYYKERKLVSYTNNVVDDLIDFEIKDVYKPLINEFKNYYGTLSKKFINSFLDLIVDEERDANNHFKIKLNENRYLYVDLYFKDKFIPLNEEIYDKITKDSTGNILDEPKQVYLYINDTCIDEFKDPLTWRPNALEDDYVRSIEDKLVPLFNNVYFSDYQYVEFKQLIYSTNIIKIGNSDDKKKNIYIYNKDGYACFYEIDNKQKYIYDKLKYIIVNNDIVSELSYIYNNYIDLLDYSKFIIMFNDTNENNEIWNNIVKFVYDKTGYIYNIDNEKRFKEIYDELFNLILNKNYVSQLKSGYNISYEDLYNYTSFEKNIVNNEYLYNHIIDYVCSYYNMTFYTYIDINNINSTIDETIKVNYNIKYNDHLNIYTFNKDNLTYGFAIINIILTNTNISFNIYNDDKYNFIINTINDIDINESIYKYFSLIYPFIKINIFDLALSNILSNIIVLPESYKLNIKYQFNYNTQLINKLNTYKYIKLIRYFSNIMPLFENSYNVLTNNYIQLYKTNNIDNTIEDKTYIRNIKDNINLYYGIYTLIEIFTNINSNSLSQYIRNKELNSELCYIEYNNTNFTYDNFIDYLNSNNLDNVNNIRLYTYLKDIEYKHFNNNKVYYLQNEIIINFKNNFMKLEDISDDLIKNEFKKYIIKNANYSLLENEILFLYNKYECIKNINTIDFKDNIYNNQLYKVQLKFILK